MTWPHDQRSPSPTRPHAGGCEMHHGHGGSGGSTSCRTSVQGGERWGSGWAGGEITTLVGAIADELTSHPRSGMRNTSTRDPEGTSDLPPCRRSLSPHTLSSRFNLCIEGGGSPPENGGGVGCAGHRGSARLRRRALARAASCRMGPHPK